MLLELLEEALAAARVGVAAVHKSMDIDLAEALLLGYTEELVDVVEG